MQRPYLLTLHPPLKPVYLVCMWQEYIISDKQVLLGKPIVKGTRISVELILELFAAGWTESQLLKSYPNLSEDALRAVFLYLRDCIQQEFYFPLQVSA